VFYETRKPSVKRKVAIFFQKKFPTENRQIDCKQLVQVVVQAYKQQSTEMGASCTRCNSAVTTPLEAQVDSLEEISCVKGQPQSQSRTSSLSRNSTCSPCNNRGDRPGSHSSDNSTGSHHSSAGWADHRALGFNDEDRPLNRIYVASRPCPNQLNPLGKQAGKPPRVAHTAASAIDAAPFDQDAISQIRSNSLKKCSDCTQTIMVKDVTVVTFGSKKPSALWQRRYGNAVQDQRMAPSFLTVHPVPRDNLPASST